MNKKESISELLKVNEFDKYIIYELRPKSTIEYDKKDVFFGYTKDSNKAERMRMLVSGYENNKTKNKDLKDFNYNRSKGEYLIHKYKISNLDFNILGDGNDEKETINKVRKLVSDNHDCINERKFKSDINHCDICDCDVVDIKIHEKSKKHQNFLNKDEYDNIDEVLCECGHTFKLKYMGKHLASKKHINSK